MPTLEDDLRQPRHWRHAVQLIVHDAKAKPRARHLDERMIPLVGLVEYVLQCRVGEEARLVRHKPSPAALAVDDERGEAAFDYSRPIVKPGRRQLLRELLHGKRGDLVAFPYTVTNAKRMLGLAAAIALHDFIVAVARVPHDV